MMQMKVMTDEQIETLRIQIAIYTEISKKLAEMHKMFMHMQDPSDVKLENTSSDPLMVNNGGHRMSCRKRWSPTPKQLQILESAFESGNGTPSKEKIKDITAELSHHGQISETNVYTWFQNRRARSKKRLQNVVIGHGNDNHPEDEKPPVESMSKDNHVSELSGMKLD